MNKNYLILTLLCLVTFLAEDMMFKGLGLALIGLGIGLLVSEALERKYVTSLQELIAGSVEELEKKDSLIQALRSYTKALQDQADFNREQEEKKSDQD